MFRDLGLWLRLVNIEKDKIKFLLMKQDIYTLFPSRSSLKLYDGAKWTITLTYFKDDLETALIFLWTFMYESSLALLDCIVHIFW